MYHKNIKTNFFSVFSPFRTIQPRFNTKIRDYELIARGIKSCNRTKSNYILLFVLILSICLFIHFLFEDLFRLKKETYCIRNSGNF